MEIGDLVPSFNLIYNLSWEYFLGKQESCKLHKMNFCPYSYVCRQFLASEDFCLKISSRALERNIAM